MKITNFKLKIIKNEDKPNLLGLVDLELDNQLAIHDIRLIRTNSGKQLLSFPSKRVKKYSSNKDGGFDESYQYTDLVHPLTAEFREQLESQIFDIYKKQIEGDKNKNE